MNFSLTPIITWRGTIDRKGYVVWGLILFSLKYNLDRLIAAHFDRSWYITDYFVQADQLTIGQLTEADKLFYSVLMLQSLPFIWAGTVLCMKRLRNAALPSSLVIFFFIPFINFLLFVALSVMPENESQTEAKTKFLDRLIPKSAIGSAMLAVCAVSIMGLGLTGLMVNYLRAYGWSLFVGVPFLLGYGSVIIHGHHRRLTFGDSVSVAFSSVLLFSLIVFILAFEGIICIAMALPLLVAVAFIGASIAYAIKNRKTTSLNVLLAPLLAIPGIGFTEHLVHQTAPAMHVSTEMVINAPKQQVWDELVAFSRIGEPSEWIFKTGIAYPLDAKISGVGPGAIRRCNFTTGSFIEPITIWNEPDLLEFGVLQQPPPMVEWSIYQDLRIEHLDGYFRSVKGQFKLEALANGGTRLTGTTWYTHAIWPMSYWKLWSDFILHHIHNRVLTHIKKESEQLGTR